MIFCSKRKKLIKYLDSFLHDPNKISRYITSGVSESELSDYIHRLLLIKMIDAKSRRFGSIRSFFVKQQTLSSNEITEYARYCVDENYMVLEYGCLRVSSKGKKFISKNYPLIYIWKSWLEPYIFPALVSLLVSALFWWFKK